MFRFIVKNPYQGMVFRVFGEEICPEGDELVFEPPLEIGANTRFSIEELNPWTGYHTHRVRSGDVINTCGVEREGIRPTPAELIRAYGGINNRRSQIALLIFDRYFQHFYDDPFHPEALQLWPYFVDAISFPKKEALFEKVQGTLLSRNDADALLLGLLWGASIGWKEPVRCGSWFKKLTKALFQPTTKPPSIGYARHLYQYLAYFPKLRVVMDGWSMRLYELESQTLNPYPLPEDMVKAWPEVVSGILA